MVFEILGIIGRNVGSESNFPGTIADGRYRHTKIATLATVRRKVQVMTVVQTQITSDAKIHGGEPVIGGTSTTVRAIAELWNQGMPAEEVPIRLPHLELAQVFEALRYYLTHRDEIEGFITKNHIPEELSGVRFEAATGNTQ